MPHMVGASNKPFDNMTCDLPLLVTDLPDWVATFVESGLAVPVILTMLIRSTKLRWYLEHADERRLVGRRCQDQIRRAWNYKSVPMFWQG